MGNYKQNRMAAEVSIGKYVYRKESIIGHGSFAIVFKGRFKEDRSKLVAVKCINQKNLSKTYALLQKEIQILKQLKHENIVQLYDCYQDKTGIHLVMEFCNGGDLADYLSRKKVLSEPVIRLFLRQIAAALKVLHDKSIVHRDLKPQNILLAYDEWIKSPQPEEIRVKVADFGFARHLEVDAMAATLCGSPMYMAPEVMTSQTYDSRADIWSLATIVYQCHVGRAPFYAQNPQKLRALYENSPVLIPTIPERTSPALRSMLLAMLKKDPQERCTFTEFFRSPFLVPPDERTATSSQFISASNAKQIPFSSNQPQLPHCRTAPTTDNYLSTSPGGNTYTHRYAHESPDTRFATRTSPSPSKFSLELNEPAESSSRESSTSFATSSGESDRVLCHDEEEEIFSQNLSSTITGDIDTPEGFVMIPSNLDEFGQVVSSRKTSNTSSPKSSSDGRTGCSQPGSSSPGEHRQQQPSVSNAVSSTPTGTGGMSRTPPKAPCNLSPIDRHRIITESQGVKFIVGSPPKSPVQMGGRPSEGAQNAAGTPSIQRSNSSTKQLYYPPSYNRKRSDSENNGSNRTSPGYYNNNIWNFAKTQTTLSAEKIPSAIDLSAKLSRACTFHHLESPGNGRNQGTDTPGMIAERTANYLQNQIVSDSRKGSVPSNYATGAFGLHNTKISTEPNLVTLIQEANLKPICANGQITVPAGWHQAAAGLDNQNFGGVNTYGLNQITAATRHGERTLSAPNFPSILPTAVGMLPSHKMGPQHQTHVPSNAIVSYERNSPIHTSPMRKLSSEILHIAYSPPRLHKDDPNYIKSSTSCSNLNIHQQLCDSNSDLANELPLNLFSVSPSHHRRSRNFGGSRTTSTSDIDLLPPPDLSDLNIMPEKERELAENMTMALSISQCLFKFADSTEESIPGITSDTASDYLKDRSWDKDIPIELNQVTEKMMFLLRSLEIIKNCADIVKETQQEVEISSKTKLILKEVHDTFARTLGLIQKLCIEHPEYSNLTLSTDQLRSCANRVIYAKALQSCREAALDEQSSCFHRAHTNYRNAQLLLSCLLLDNSIERDRVFISGVFQMVDSRIDCCLQNKSSSMKSIEHQVSTAT